MPSDAPHAARALQSPENDTIPTFPFEFDGISPPREYATRRTQCPLGKVHLVSGHDAVLVVKYDDVAAALADPRLSHDLHAPGSPRFVTGPSHYDQPLPTMNSAKHRRYRRIVSPAFTSRSIERWKPAIEQIAVELLDRISQAGPPIDMASGFCLEFPARVLCRILGIPDEDVQLLCRWSNAFVSSASLDAEERARLITEFSAYVWELVSRRRSDPGDALIDELITVRDSADRLTDVEVVEWTMGLFAAGTETTANSFGRFLLTLLGNGREKWEELCAHPELVPGAVDELLRLVCLSRFGQLRMASEDVDLPSGRIEAGTAVVLSSNSAMRDENAYADAEEIRFDRGGPPLLAFGRAAHMCVGMNLAKAELGIALRLLTDRFPTLDMDTTVGELAFSDGTLQSSLIAFPVTW
ncbi:cytochrome P450 [Nocardia aobensis]|uniref:Cytochrome P450 n=1 Tax=Nocardia aobensis TaxID=257277 RepID=A0ABW6PDU1_9NOCA